MVDAAAVGGDGGDVPVETSITFRFEQFAQVQAVSTRLISLGGRFETTKPGKPG